MILGAMIPVVAYALVSAAVGLRLSLLWRRTGEAPEACLGGGLLLVSLALPVAAIGRSPALGETTLGRVLFCAGVVGAVSGACAIVAFHGVVFRDGGRARSWGGAAWLGAVAAGLGWIVFCTAQGSSLDEIRARMEPGILAVVAAIGVGFAWGGTMSLRYHAQLVRRARLGLGDPVVANRFWLWGISDVAVTALVLVLGGYVASGATVLQEPVPLTVLAATTALLAVTWLLTFFPPERYLRAVRARSV